MNLKKLIINIKVKYISCEKGAIEFMNLKESYRYANFLDNLLDTAYSYLRNKGFITSTKQNHLRSKVNNEVIDEITDVKKPYDVEFTPNNVIDFAVKVLSEKEKLSTAIACAKATTEINIDNAIAMNKKKQGFVSVLNGMVGLKPNTSTIPGSGYKFNHEGNQVKYYYDIEQTTTIDFNRNDVKALIKKYNRICDEVSAKLDSIEITTEVDHTPLFDINDTFEDLIVTE